MSLAEKMWRAYQLALAVVYEPHSNPAESCTTLRANAPDDEELWAWVDGLWHKYAEKRTTGQCSLQAMIDFDVERFEQMVDEHIVRFMRYAQEVSHM